LIPLLLVNVLVTAFLWMRYHAATSWPARYAFLGIALILALIAWNVRELSYSVGYLHVNGVIEFDPG
jgi:hypothetical protein